ncbi:hypothetical protein BDD12DRAFT_839866 [Trichophaea hybrida]|nr:hypothetical protein BDD12DRAFT_839866 [Trichophaea hybrida]
MVERQILPSILRLLGAVDHPHFVTWRLAAKLDERTPLEFAFEKNLLNVMESLFEAGANPMDVYSDSMGFSRTIFIRNEPAVQLLLKYAPDPNLASKWYIDALVSARFKGLPRMVDLLLERSAILLMTQEKCEEVLISTVE